MQKQYFHTQKRIWCAMIAMIMLFSSLVFSVQAEDLSEYEQDHYLHNTPSPMESEPELVKLSELSDLSFKNTNYSLSLDGSWEMINNGNISSLLAGKGWNSAIEAQVPGSIYTALYSAGKISDPYEEKNMKAANKYSGWHWYFRKIFNYGGESEKVELAFDGICNVADIYLNGTLISSHEGMFGGPYVDVSEYIIKGENTLIVHLYPAKDWKETVVFNSSYGWHYSMLYPLGIWQSVTVRDLPSVTLDSPFIATENYQSGTVDLAIPLQSNKDIEGKLTVAITPKNFDGKTTYFEKNITLEGTSKTTLRYRCDIPDHKLWWPLGYGEQNLYTLEVVFDASDGSRSYYSAQFGIRELDFEAMPDGESDDTYNRTVVINGSPIYLKGAGWCTIDSMMRFTYEDYDRILSRARDAGINFLRAWGGGLVETDEFYDLCDEYGICVYQEWPCAWDSHQTQPTEVLYETVILNTKRLRNRPSLIIWGGGNEGDGSFNDETLNNMGKLTYEYDGTRDFWRQDCGTGGKNMLHEHIHWSGESPEFYLTAYSDLKNTNIHEYGLDCLMNIESIKKFADENEITEWPISAKGSIAYHTATFNMGGIWLMKSPNGYDLDVYKHYSDMFLEADSLEELILGSQMAQAQADYLPAINARTNYPYSTANIVYKLNDNYPGGSWSIVDWYGSPKIAYYLMQDAYRPLMSAIRLDRYNTAIDGVPQALTVPVYLLDDVQALGTDTPWEVKITAYGGGLNTIKSQSFSGHGVDSTANLVGEFSLDADQADTYPLILVTDLIIDGEFYNRTYAYLNFEQKQGSLFSLPRVTLEYSINGNVCTITNTGSVAAVGVHILCPASSDSLSLSDNYVFLDSGESIDIISSDGSKIEGVSCFNMCDTSDSTPPFPCSDIKITYVSDSSISLSWSGASDDRDLLGYNIYLEDSDGNIINHFVGGKQTETTVKRLSDDTEYFVTIKAEDNNFNLSSATEPIKVRTKKDTTRPTVVSAAFADSDIVQIVFSTPIEKSSAEDLNNFFIDNGATITSASLLDDQRTVLLKTDLVDGIDLYTIGIVGVTDTKKNKNTLLFSSFKLERNITLHESFEDPTFLEGISSSSPEYEAGKFGNALKSSAGGGVKLDQVNYTFNQGKTISLWTKGKVSDSYNVMLAKGPKTAGHFEFYVYQGNLYFFAPELKAYDLGFEYNQLSGWSLLTFVWEEDTIKVYVNGKLETTTPVQGAIRETSGSVSFGSLIDGTLIFGGSIDEVKFYDRILSNEEIASIYDRSKKLYFKNTSAEIEIDETIKLNCIAQSDINYTITLRGDSVRINDDGTITAISEGESIIIVTSDDGRYFSAMTVKVNAIEEITTEDGTQTVTEPPIEDESETASTNKPDTESTSCTEEPSQESDIITKEEIKTSEKNETESGSSIGNNGCRSSISAFSVVITLCLSVLIFVKRKKH